MDVSVVYNFLTLNVGPPLGLIKYKKERIPRWKLPRACRTGHSDERGSEHLHANIAFVVCTQTSVPTQITHGMVLLSLIYVSTLAID